MPRRPMVFSRLVTLRLFVFVAHRQEAADAELLAALVEHAREDQMQLDTPAPVIQCFLPLMT